MNKRISELSNYPNSRRLKYSAWAELSRSLIQHCVIVEKHCAKTNHPTLSRGKCIFSRRICGQIPCFEVFLNTTHDGHFKNKPFTTWKSRFSHFWYQYKGSVGVQSHEFVNPIFNPWTLSQNICHNQGFYF